jgi:hypothetical protein
VALKSFFTAADDFQVSLSDATVEVAAGRGSVAEGKGGGGQGKGGGGGGGGGSSSGGGGGGSSLWAKARGRGGADRGTTAARPSDIHPPSPALLAAAAEAAGAAAATATAAAIKALSPVPPLSPRRPRPVSLVAWHEHFEAEVADASEDLLVVVSGSTAAAAAGDDGGDNSSSSSSSSSSSNRAVIGRVIVPLASLPMGAPLASGDAAVAAAPGPGGKAAAAAAAAGQWSASPDGLSVEAWFELSAAPEPTAAAAAAGERDCWHTYDAAAARRGPDGRALGFVKLRLALHASHGAAAALRTAAGGGAGGGGARGGSRGGETMAPAAAASSTLVAVRALAELVTAAPCSRLGLCRRRKRKRRARGRKSSSSSSSSPSAAEAASEPGLVADQLALRCAMYVLTDAPRPRQPALGATAAADGALAFLRWSAGEGGASAPAGFADAHPGAALLRRAVLRADALLRDGRQLAVAGLSGFGGRSSGLWGSLGFGVRVVLWGYVSLLLPPWQAPLLVGGVTLALGGSLAAGAGDGVGSDSEEVGGVEDVDAAARRLLGFVTSCEAAVQLLGWADPATTLIFAAAAMLLLLGLATVLLFLPSRLALFLAGFLPALAGSVTQRAPAPAGGGGDGDGDGGAAAAPAAGLLAWVGIVARRVLDRVPDAGVMLHRDCCTSQVRLRWCCWCCCCCCCCCCCRRVLLPVRRSSLL